MLLIKNVYLYEPSSGKEGKADILIRDGIFEKIRDASDASLPEAAPRAGGMFSGKISPSVSSPASPPSGEAFTGASPQAGLPGRGSGSGRDGLPGRGCGTESERSLPAGDGGGMGGSGGGGLRVLDGTGLCAAPGFIDTHAHFRDPGYTYKEDLHTGALAAAKGGYTSVVLMANTNPPVDRPEILADILARAKRERIHIYSCANVTLKMGGKEAVDFDALAGAGAAGFTDDGVPVMDEAILKKALDAAVRLDLPVSLHEEDKNLIAQNGINAGSAAAKKLGLTGSPREAEISLIRRDLELAVQAGAPLCIQHISTAEGVELVRSARKKSPRIHAEATPHHFSLTEDAILECGTLAKVNPPLRTEKDRRAVIEGLMDGTLDLIATDHAPHADEEKEKSFASAPSGMIGLETAFSLGLRELVSPGFLSMNAFLACLTCHPADFYHLNAGRVAEGAPADLVIFDPDASWTVEKPFASRSSNSPFLGQTLPGVIRYTIAGGEVVYEKA